ncbi:MAG: TIR domain-containing protein [Saprospiraceae bacterium]|nr:TIR domain-containing protein [Saprospiraceae bacterium]
MSELALKLIAENKARHARGLDARALDLRNTGLEKLPDELFDLFWLEVLDLGYIEDEKSWWIQGDEWWYDPVGIPNEIQYIDENINKLNKLQIIDFSKNPLKNIDAVLNLHELKKIIIHDTEILDLAFLKSINSLIYLDAKRTKIQDVSQLNGAINLNFLNIESSLICDIKPIANLFNLQCLNISTTIVRNLKPLSKLKNLKQLYLNDLGKQKKDVYSVWQINDGVKNINPLRNLKKLERLEIDGAKNLDDLSALKNMYELQHLSFSETAVADLGPISSLIKLEYLCMKKTRVKRLDPVSELINLKTLKFSETEIFDLYPIEKINKIKEIEAHTTRVEDLTPLEQKPDLHYVDIAMTKVKDLSPLKNIIINNKIPVIDKYNSYLYGYNDEHTRLATHQIFVGGCPIEVPPPEMIGYSYLIEAYFAERSKQQFKNTEIKLFLLGNATTGKTTLSRYLREQIYALAQPTTHGIQNHRWQSPNGREMEVNIWDFGGQEYYHATHRLFLSRNAVYALVWDAKTDKGGIEPTEIHYENDPQTYIVPLEHFSKAWWLKNIHFNLSKYPRHEREGDAPIPVLLVQNKCASGKDYQEASVPREFEQEPYWLKPAWTKHHLDLAAAANEQANGVQGEWTIRFKLFENELLKALESRMATYEFAIYHRDIRDHVRALVSGETPRNEMSWTDFEALCLDIEPDAKMDLVQIYLRDITGDILYFDQNERLKHRVFLRPDWVCNRIYTILSRKVLEYQGLFDLTWVREALQCEEQEALDFVELMREFHLVFAENDENGEPTGHYVAPQYLPNTCTKPDKLEAAIEYANLTHAFTLWFPDFLPKSHIARFVAYWGGKAKQRLFWKNGLLFQTEGCTILVERLTEEDKIQVEIQTNNRAKREAAIRRIFQSFLDLEDGQGFWNKEENEPWELPNGEGFWQFGDNAKFAVSTDGSNYALWSEIYYSWCAKATRLKSYPLETSKFIDIQPFSIFYKPIIMAKKVFISYSHKDESFKDELDTHFSALKRSGLVDVWHDRRIDASTEWDDAIKSELEAADIILLLVSANFLASEYIWKVEIARAMERHRAKEAKVIPIFIRSCDVKGMPFEGIQGLPRDAKPIASFTDKDEAYFQIAKGIRAILEN